FFQAEDGIRDRNVTGVQTCALPILVMEIPVDEPVHVTLISRDVMHGFYVPAFLFMRNAIPGHPTTFTFTANKLGSFPGQCTEFRSEERRVGKECRSRS